MVIVVFEMMIGRPWILGQGKLWMTKLVVYPNSLSDPLIRSFAAFVDHKQVEDPAYNWIV